MWHRFRKNAMILLIAAVYKKSAKGIIKGKTKKEY
jgi:hypothetical protein